MEQKTLFERFKKNPLFWIFSVRLFFLSLKGTYKAMGCEERNTKSPQFTDHCFTGDYPIDVSDILKINSELNESK